MNLQDLLFRFGGRINRAKYWSGIAAHFAFWLVVIAIIELLPFGTFGDTPSYVVLGAGSIGAIWISLAVSAKRLHDRNKSAWWILLFLLLPAVLMGVGAGIGMSSFGLPLETRVTFAADHQVVVDGDAQRLRCRLDLARHLDVVARRLGIA